MPDVYVPLDTTRFTRLHREMSAKSCINTTALKWTDMNRKRLSKLYNTNAFRKERAKLLAGKSVDYEDYREGFERFKAEFTVPQEMLDMLRAKAEEAKIQVTDSAFQASIPMLTLQLKAFIARDLFDMSEYFEIINATSEIYQRGLEAIKDEKLFENIKSK